MKTGKKPVFGGRTYLKGINSFFDLTQSEFSKFYLLPKKALNL